MQDEREHLAKTFDLLLSISLPLMMKYFSRIILRIFVTLNVLQFKILKRNPLTFTTRIKMKFYEPSQRKIQSDRKFALVIFHFFQLLISFALIFDCIKHKARTSRTQKVKWLLISVVKCFFFSSHSLGLSYFKYFLARRMVFYFKYLQMDSLKK